MAATAYMIWSFGIVSAAKFFVVFGLIWGCCMGLVLALGLVFSPGIMLSVYAIAVLQAAPACSDKIPPKNDPNPAVSDLIEFREPVPSGFRQPSGEPQKSSGLSP
jgi:hypothetical protein